MTNVKMIWLDCDGTWIDLYGVDNWLEMLINHNPTPYVIAKPMVNLSWLARTIHELQANGIKVGIISWLAKNSTEEYDRQVTKAKLDYFKTHLPSVEFDKIHIIPYGTPKQSVGQGILFDDELQNRENWQGIAYDEKNLIQQMRKILKEFGQN